MAAQRGLPEDERADLRWEGEVWCGRGEALPWAAAAVVCAAVDSANERVCRVLTLAK